MMRGLPEKMFARPEADLKPDVADFRIEVFRGIGVLSKIEPHLRKQRCNERRLTAGKLLALAAAVELAARKLADAYGTSLSVIVGAFLQEIATGDVSIEYVMQKLERQSDGRGWSRRDLYRY